MTECPASPPRISFACCASCGSSFLFHSNKSDALIRCCPACHDSRQSADEELREVIGRVRARLESVIEACLDREDSRLTYIELTYAICEASEALSAIETPT